MSAAEYLYRQALALPGDERRKLAARLVASLVEDEDEDDGIELDPADVAEAGRELDAHLADPSTSIDETTFRARVADRWGVG